MTTAEIEHYQPRDVATLNREAGSVGRIAEWAEGAHAAYEVAKTLCQTSFIPDVFRDKPMELTAAILTGGEVGLSPMAAANAFDVIQGRATPRAITQRAVAQSRGHDIVLVDSSEARCVMKGRRSGSAEWQQVTWTIQRAQKLKLTGKTQWQTQPQAMLVARATGEICRLVASDALLGIAYNTEEIQDDDPAQQAATGRTMRRKPAVTRLPAPSPPLPDEAPQATRTAREQAPQEGPPLPGEEEVHDLTEQVTRAQLTKIHTSFTAAGINDRNERLLYAAEVVGRELGSSKDLTSTEASQVIDALDSDHDVNVGDQS